MPYIFRKYVPSRAIAFGLGEGALIFAAVCVGYILFGGGAPYNTGLLVARGFLITCLFQLCLYYFDLYEFSSKPDPYDMAIRITQAWGVASVIIAMIYLVVPAVIMSTRTFVGVFLLAYGGVLVWRGIYVLTIEHRLFTTRLLVIGSGEQAEKIVRKLQEVRDSGYSIVAQIGEKGERPRLTAREAVVYPDTSDLVDIVNRNRVGLVVVALDDRRGKMPVRELLDCKLAGRNIENGVSFFEGLTGTILVENMSPSWLIFSEGFNRNRQVQLLKRFMDVLLSSIGLVVSSPLALLSTIIIKLESPGPLLYRQKRVGLGGRTFEVIKFRSMREDAEREGPVWAQKNDPRVTRYGAFMRRSRIDEIPQLWNILRRDMSFVGPRPERPEFVQHLEERIPYYALRHTVLPGLTGWAQVRYPYGASEEDALRKLEYDLYYVKNMNILMDTMIILQTIKTVLFQKGGR